MNTSIPVIILAAGNSSRMFPLCSNEHKAMLKLAGTSIVARTAQAVEQAGFGKIIIITNPSINREELLTELTVVAPSAEVFFVTQDEATGMGDAVLAARQYLTNDQFFVIAPYHFGAFEVMEQCLKLGTSAVVCTTTTSTPWEYGIVKIEGNTALGIVEKPTQGTEPSNQKVQACYLLNQDFLTILDQTEKTHYSFETALDSLMEQKKVGNISLEQPLPSLKYPWNSFDFQKSIFETFTESSIHPTAQVAPTAVLDDSQGSIIVEAGAKIGHASRIVGPTYIGKNVLVGDFCLIRESSIEADSVVGANTEVVRSLIMSHSSIHFGYLADSIIDQKVKIGAGLVTANKRLDRKEIATTVKENRIPTGRKSLGIIAGQGAEIGIKVGTMPGVLIGPKSKIFPGSTLFMSTTADEVVKK